MIIIYIFCILLCISYATIISIITYGWFKLKTYKPSGKEPITKISIIIPAKNEENNIIKCLDGLIDQDYPVELYEIVVIDDNSDDNTYNIVKSHIDSNSGKRPEIILIKTESSNQLIAGKKQALRAGIKRSSGEVIITSDADCRFNNNWIRIIADYFENNDIKLLIGGVSFLKSKNSIINMQLLEFLGLIASAAGFARLGKPILGNAANLSFRKNAFLDVEKYRRDYDHASGDDIFLIQQINKLYGVSSISFLKNREAFVYTGSKSTLREFFSQRMRWVSKSRINKEPITMVVAWITLLFNLILLAGLIAGIFYKQAFVYICILLLIKIIIDFPVMTGIASFTNRKKLLWLLLPLEIINIFYVVIIAVAGNFFKTRWKGRKVY